jgi:hypothetical protein
LHLTLLVFISRVKGLVRDENFVSVLKASDGLLIRTFDSRALLLQPVHGIVVETGISDRR